MRSPLRTGRQRKLYWLIWSLLGIVLSVQTLRMRLAESAVRNDMGSVAASIRPQNGWGRALNAERLFEQGNTAGAIRESLAALNATPLAVVALRVLAGSRDRLLGPGSGESAWQAAAALGWRDGQTQLWALQRALANRDFTVAAVRADALLRTRGNLRQEHLAIVRVAALDPRFRAAIIERLDVQPPWRLPYFRLSLESSKDEIRGVYSVLQTLHALGRNYTRNEAHSLIDIALDRRDYRMAVGLYRLVHPGNDGRNELLPDGSFTRPPEHYHANSTAFDWRIPTEQGGTTLVNEKGQLLVEVEGGTKRTIIKRYVPLARGGYSLGYQQSEDADSPASFAVRVACADGVVLGTSQPPSQRPPLSGERKVNFNVPTHCTLVSISIEVEALDGPGSARFDDFSLQRV